MTHVPSPTMKSALSPARQRLVELMQETHFGRIEMLEVRNGEPVLVPEPRIVREIVLGKVNGPNPAREKTDFSLRKEVRDLIEVFDREPQLLVETLWIQNGLPVRLAVTNGHRIA
jgi:hypothetical protein